MGNSLLLDVRAVDRDAGRNSEVHYRLRDQMEFSVSHSRKMGPSSLLLCKQLSTERLGGFYEIKLEAIDCGSNPLSATATLMVTVTDVDDNCPSFGPGGPRGVAIPGDSPRNMSVAQVRATDPDSAPNAAIICSLSPKVSKRAKKLFSLDSRTGDVRLAQDLQSDNSEELC